MYELEAYIKENFQINSEQSILSFLEMIKPLCDISQPQNIRKAGFLCFTVLSRLLKDANLNMNMLHTLIISIIIYFRDNDTKIVLSAAECLYNIMKYYQDVILTFFNDIFEGFFLIVVNQEPEVREIMKTLDSFLKEIVNFKFQANQLYIILK
jgi:hypothetical protein